MKRWIRLSVISALVVANLLPLTAFARRHTTVVTTRGAGVRTPTVIHPGFPITRSVPGTVIVRPARTSVIMTAPLVYMAPVTWAAVTAPTPPRPRLVWQDEEYIYKDEQWVECNFGIDGHGLALYLEVRGKVQLSFAEVTFGNGEVQAVDFLDQQKGSGIYRLADFSDGRDVKTVRVLALATSDEAKLKAYLLK